MCTCTCTSTQSRTFAPPFVQAREFLAMGDQLARALPRGESALKQQFTRAADSVLLNTAEGAGRRTAADKARLFDIARGSATECAAALDIMGIRKLACAAQLLEARTVLHRVVRLLSGLARLGGGGRRGT